jgi:hypothetical protein
MTENTSETDQKCENCGRREINVRDQYCSWCWHKVDDSNGCDCDDCSLDEDDEEDEK